MDNKSKKNLAEKKSDSTKSRLKVFVRCRPFLEHEAEEDETPVIMDEKKKNLVIQKLYEVKDYSFDRVFDTSTK